MRPEREDIAAPELPDAIEWIGEAPKSMPVATASGPVLAHFFDYAQLNSVRTLPYVSEWARRYSGDGLTVLGVQAPRFPFGSDPDAVAAGLRRLGIEFPVAIDARRDLWHSYGCEGWPSLFLWKRGGALAWFHFGEGEYAATEEAIQAELREADALRDLPAPMEPLRPTDAPDAKVMPPTPEVLPGGSWERPWVAGESGPPVLELPYEAGGVYLTAEGNGEIELRLDGWDANGVVVRGAALYELVSHPCHEQHTLALRASPGVKLWSVSFAAGVP